MSETCCDKNIYTYAASPQNADDSTRQTIASQTEKQIYEGTENECHLLFFHKRLKQCGDGF